MEAEHDTPINFRSSKDLRDRFDSALKANGVRLSETLRAFMDEYATRYEEKLKK